MRHPDDLAGEHWAASAGDTVLARLLRDVDELSPRDWAAMSRGDLAAIVHSVIDGSATVDVDACRDFWDDQLNTPTPSDSRVRLFLDGALRVARQQEERIARSREARLRHRAQQAGLKLEEARTRDWLSGTFQLVDPHTNSLVHGSDDGGFGLSLDEIEAALDE